MARSTAVGWVRHTAEDPDGALGWPAVPRGTARVEHVGRGGHDVAILDEHDRPSPTSDRGAPEVAAAADPSGQPGTPVPSGDAAVADVSRPDGVDPRADDEEAGTLVDEDLAVPALDQVPAAVATTSSQEAARMVEDPRERSVGASGVDTPEAQRPSVPVEDARPRIAPAPRALPRPAHTRLLTVANQKGGVGKTTTTVNVAAALAQAGLRVLVLDSDPQGNASTALGIDHHAGVPGLYDVLVDGVPLHEVIQECPTVPGLFCAPATIDLAGAEIELVSVVARENRLRGALVDYLRWRDQTGQERLDYVFMDCPPSLGLLTLNAFVAAHEVLIPIQCEYYALEGLSQLLSNIEMITKHLNPGLHVSSILLTMYDARTRLAAQVADEVRDHFGATVLASTVPRSVRVSEAPSYGQTVMTYDPASSGALSYLAAARELAERGAEPTAAGSATGTTHHEGGQR